MVKPSPNGSAPLYDPDRPGSQPHNAGLKLVYDLAFNGPTPTDPVAALLRLAIDEAEHRARLRRFAAAARSFAAAAEALAEGRP